MKIKIDKRLGKANIKINDYEAAMILDYIGNSWQYMQNSCYGNDANDVIKDLENLLKPLAKIFEKDMECIEK